MTSIRSELSRPSVERHMSRLIVEERQGAGVPVRHDLSIVELKRNADGMIEAYSISPFMGETASTIYHDRPLRLTIDPTGRITLMEAPDLSPI